jgi:hypothetical protein
LYRKENSVNVGGGGHSTILDEERQVVMGKLSNKTEDVRVKKAEDLLLSDDLILFATKRLKLIMFKKNKFAKAIDYKRMLIRHEKLLKLEQTYYQCNKNGAPTQELYDLVNSIE